MKGVLARCGFQQQQQHEEQLNSFACTKSCSLEKTARSLGKLFFIERLGATIGRA